MEYAVYGFHERNRHIGGRRTYRYRVRRHRRETWASADGSHGSGVAGGVPGDRRRARADRAAPGAATTRRDPGVRRGSGDVRPAGPPDCASFAARRRSAAPMVTKRVCYGDPGIAAACGALRCWVRRLPGAAEPRSLPRRDGGNKRRSVPGLCHGAIGLGHLLNRCYQASGDAARALRDAARRWFTRGLALRGQGEGIGRLFMTQRRHEDSSRSAGARRATSSRARRASGWRCSRRSGHRSPAGIACLPAISHSALVELIAPVCCPYLRAHSYGEGRNGQQS